MTDHEGCTAVHWAAYGDNVFLIRLFKRMGMDIFKGDNNRHAPLIKALLSTAYNAIRILIKERPFNLKVYKIDPKEFSDRPSLKCLLEKELDKYDFRMNFFIRQKSLAVFINRFAELIFTLHKS